MVAKTYNLLIEKGSRFRRELRILVNGEPKDLTGYQARSWVKRDFKDLENLIDIPAEIDPPAGRIVLRLTSEQTESLPENCSPCDIPKNFLKPICCKYPRAFVWGISLILPDEDEIRLLSGSVLIIP